MVKILNIGSGHAAVQFDDVEETLLDANPHEKPDILCDICDLKKLEGGVYDGVWAKHVIEHVFEYRVPEVLEGIWHVLKEDGFLYVAVPDLRTVMKQVVEKDMKLDDLLYTSYTGLKVRVLDIFYGHWEEVKKLKCLQSHKTGFDLDLMLKRLSSAGFQKIFTSESNFEVKAIACKNEVPEWVERTFKINEEKHSKEICETV
jgi:predicted SAM-dependent methyltransferase